MRGVGADHVHHPALHPHRMARGGRDGGGDPARLGHARAEAGRAERQQGGRDRQRPRAPPALRPHGQRQRRPRQRQPGPKRRLPRQADVERRAQPRGHRRPQEPALGLRLHLRPGVRGEARRELGRPRAHGKDARPRVRARRPSSPQTYDRSLRHDPAQPRPPGGDAHRALPHRLHAHWHRADRPVQQAFRAPPRRDLPRARGGHRPRALHRRQRGGDLRRPALAGAGARPAARVPVAARGASRGGGGASCWRAAAPTATTPRAKTARRERERCTG